MTDPTPADIPSLVELGARFLWADGQRRLATSERDLPRSRTDFHARAESLLDHPALLDVLSTKEDAVGGGEADIKLFVTELLSHRGERPWRVLKGGQELWETWVPAVKAAFAAAPPTPAVEGIPAGMVAWGPDHPDYPNAPSDWDGGEMLCRDGRRLNGHAGGEPFWDHSFGSGDIIAYTPKARPTASDGESRERITRIIDPDAFDERFRDYEGGNWQKRALSKALAKANAILAALPTTDGAGEVERLRTALIACGRHAGAFLADSVSTDFLMNVPEEVKAKLATPPTTDPSERMREAEA